MADERPLMLSAGQARRYLGIGRSRFYRMVENGEIPFYREHDKALRLFSVVVLDEVAVELGRRSQREAAS